MMSSEEQVFLLVEESRSWEGESVEVILRAWTAFAICTMGDE